MAKKKKKKTKGKTKTRSILVSYDAEWVLRGEENQVLSYQLLCISGDTNWHLVKIVEDGKRLTLTTLIMLAIELGMSAKKIKMRPHRVYLVAHWTLADFSALANLDEIRTGFDSVRKSFVTIREPYVCSYSDRNHNKQKVEVVLRDTLLLAPASHRSLARIGELVGYEKLDVHMRYKENMDHFLRDDPERFEEYAIRDTLIAAAYIQHIREFAQKLYGEEEYPLAIGTMAMNFALAYWERAGVDRHAVLGTREVETQHRFERGGKTIVVKRVEDEPLEVVALFAEHARKAYHGGRNECFYFGATPRGTYTDFDLASAYATAMAILGMPRWDELRSSTDIEDFTPDVIGCAFLEFEFPETVRYPLFPERVKSGLVFPRRGTTHATAPEISLARKLGAKLKIITGCILPMDTACRPFEEISMEVGGMRKAYKAEGNDLMDILSKTVGNSVYGKLGQGIRPKSVYSSRNERMEQLKESKITNPYLASAITGYIRAVLGEILNALPKGCLVASVTTDGFLADATPGMIEAATRGPLCRLFSEARERLTGDVDVLEVKHTAERVMVWRTRGAVALEFDSGLKEKELLLAKAGIQTESWNRFEQADAIVNMFINRRFGKTTEYVRLRGLRDICEQGGDLVSKDVSIRHTMDFDWKRRATTCGVQPVDGKDHLYFETEPLEDAGEFESIRDKWKDFYQRFARPLKTPDDLRDFREFCAIKKDMKLKLPSGFPAVYAARKMVLIALVRREWGMSTRMTNSEIADAFTLAGYQTTTAEVENAKRPTIRLFDKCVAETPDVRKFLDFVKQMFPGFDETQLLA